MKKVLYTSSDRGWKTKKEQNCLHFQAVTAVFSCNYMQSSHFKFANFQQALHVQATNFTYKILTVQMLCVLHIGFPF